MDVGQRDPVCHGGFLRHHQDEVAISEALDSCWDKRRSERPTGTPGLGPCRPDMGDGRVTGSLPLCARVRLSKPFTDPDFLMHGNKTSSRNRGAIII